jgi:hypothetical protein
MRSSIVSECPVYSASSRHCSAGMDMASGRLNLPRVFLGRVLGRFVKPLYTNAKPFSRNSPTAKELVFSSPCDFLREQEQLRVKVRQFREGGEAQCTRHPHPFFGASDLPVIWQQKSIGSLRIAPPVFWRWASFTSVSTNIVRASSATGSSKMSCSSPGTTVTVTSPPWLRSTSRAARGVDFAE